MNNTFYRLPDRDAVANWERTVPPGFTFTIKMSRYVTHIKRLTDLGLGLERFYECIEPLLRSPLVLTADWTFVRFHYGSRGRRGNYSGAELQEWAARFRDWRTEREVFSYFNNDWEVFAVRNALRMKELLA